MGDHGIMLKHGLRTEGVIRMPMIWADPEAQLVNAQTYSQVH